MRDVRASMCARATVVGCVRVPGARREERRAETKTFATTLRGLRELLAWLIAHGVTQVAMESTGVYWRPVYAVLEGAVTLVLVNARHVKMVPGRKTDIRDCEWLAQLLECGLLRASFVPPRPVRDLRDLTRLRKTLIRERGHHVNRIEKTLELAQLKLGSVVTDLLGKTGRAILNALIAGIDDPHQLAELAQGLLRKKRAALREALVGGLTPHYAFLLAQHLTLIEALDVYIATLDTRDRGSDGAVGRGRGAGADHARRGCPRRRRRCWPRQGWTWPRFRRRGTSPPGRDYAPAPMRAPGSGNRPTAGKGATWLRATLQEVA